MNKSSLIIRFLYGTKLGNTCLKLMLSGRFDRVVISFLTSKCSRMIIPCYAKRHHIPLSRKQMKSYRTFRDFFVRKTRKAWIDIQYDHFISPCDGWLSIYQVEYDSTFVIKGKRYHLQDLIEDVELSNKYKDGICMIFRLEASDYHHYCYIDHGYQGENHYIEGSLHSVQPKACEKYPVYTLNRRVWTLMTTEHFGPVVQVEIGAFAVGGIVNEKENARFLKGREMGHFELAGSSIAVFIENGRVELLPKIIQKLYFEEEIKVRQGMQIGTQIRKHNYRN